MDEGLHGPTHIWIIIDGILRFVLGRHSYDILPPRARLALQNQDRIGWFPLLMGFVSRSWLPIQQDYLDRHHSKTNARQWATQLIKKLMQISWDMWADKNDAKHNDRPSVMVRCDHFLNSEIDEILAEEPPYLLPADKHLLQIPVTTLHAYTTTFKELWLKSVCGARDTFLINTHKISHGTNNSCQNADWKIKNAKTRTTESSRHKTAEKSTKHWIDVEMGRKQQKNQSDNKPKKTQKKKRGK